MSGNRNPVQFRKSGALTYTHDEHKRGGYQLTCDKCQATAFRVLKIDAPPEAIHQQFGERLGWDVGRAGRSATCPKCLAERARKRPGQSPPEDPPAMPADMSPDAFRATRRATGLLEAHFTEPAPGEPFGRYAEGWDDQRVAKESGLSPDEVARLREGAFGRVEPPALAKLRRDLAALEGHVRDAQEKLSRELAEQRALLDQLERDERAKIAGLLTDAEKIRKRLEGMR
jgi:hypothetical protein